MKRLTPACFGSVPKSSNTPFLSLPSWRAAKVAVSPVAIANSVDGMNPHVPATVVVTGLADGQYSNGSTVQASCAELKGDPDGAVARMDR